MIIVIVVIISIIYLIMLAIILQAYYKNISDIEDRVLQLEINNEKLNIRIKHYDDYIEKELKTAKIRLFFDEYSKEVKEDMPCGRKGRPKGSKNTCGGKRK